MEGLWETWLLLCTIMYCFELFTCVFFKSEKNYNEGEWKPLKSIIWEGTRPGLYWEADIQVGELAREF